MCASPLIGGECYASIKCRNVYDESVQMYMCVRILPLAHVGLFTCKHKPARLAVDMLYPICQRAVARRMRWWWETAITSLSFKAAEGRYSVSNTAPDYHKQFAEWWANNGIETHSSTRKNLHNPAWAENHPVGFLASKPCNTVPALAETGPKRITQKEGCFEYPPGRLLSG